MFNVGLWYVAKVKQFWQVKNKKGTRLDIKVQKSIFYKGEHPHHMNHQKPGTPMPERNDLDRSGDTAKFKGTIVPGHPTHKGHHLSQTNTTKTRAKGDTNPWETYPLVDASKRRS